VALSLRAASGGQLVAATPVSQVVTLPAGTATNDIVYFIVTVGAVITAPAATGWTLTLTTNATAIESTIVGYRTIQAGDTSPTVTWTTAGKVSWVAIALQPAAGTTAVHIGYGTVLNTGVTATSQTPNTYAAGTASGASVLLTGSRGSTNVATAVATTPPTNWTEPTNGDQSTATGTTAATQQIAAEVSYRLAQTGTITPGAQAITPTAFAIVHHAFAVEVAGAAATLTEDFSAALSAGKWAIGGTAAATGGRLVCACNASYTDSITSQASFSLVGSTSSIQIVPPLLTPGNGSTEQFLGWYVTGSTLNANSVSFYIHQTSGGAVTLDCVTRVASAAVTRASVAYDPATTPYLQLRESGGTLFWETSTTGTSWNTVTSWTVAGISLASLKCQIGTGNYAAETAPGNGLFDNVGIVPAATAGLPQPVVNINQTALNRAAYF
jgi:hypothetical protein